MGKRHQSIGLKQTIRLEWMQKAANLALAGLDAKQIRQELHAFLAERKGGSTEGEGSDRTRAFVVGNLMKIWVIPDPDLIVFRDASLARLQACPSMSLAIHWAMISAAYPFWLNVARQTGRLLNLQTQVNRKQILQRVKEQYGDRTTIDRETQRVIRSFVAWGVLTDTDGKGCYEKRGPFVVASRQVTALMLESSLLASPEGKAALGVLVTHPALFPFELPIITGDSVAQGAERIAVTRYGLGEDLLTLSP